MQFGGKLTVMISPYSAYKVLLKRFGCQGWWPVPEYHPRRYRAASAGEKFEICIGAILTQNTSWKNVEKAVRNLRRAGIMNPEGVAGLDSNKLAELIRPSGYYNRKALKLRSFAYYLIKKYSGDINRLFGKKKGVLRHELLQLHGVGPETADSMLLYAGNKLSFVIDTYTVRLGERLGWFRDADYATGKEYMENSLPQSLKVYSDLHALIVANAKEYCRKTPLCGGCPLERFCKYNER